MGRGVGVRHRQRRLTALLPAEARVHAARLAPDRGADGLDLVRRVTAGARPWLAPGGHLLVEVREHQVTQAMAAFTRGGLTYQVLTCPQQEATVLVSTR